MKRRYFIIELPNQNMSQALDICIGLNSTQRYSLDGNKLLVKTTNELINEKQKTYPAPMVRPVNFKLLNVPD